MAIARYNLIAKTLRETFLLLPLAWLAARGTDVEVGRGVQEEPRQKIHERKVNHGT